MLIKGIGAVLILGSCGGFGYKLAHVQLQEERMLRQLITALDYMSCELQYRLLPLPILCQQTAGECRGKLSEVFALFAAELETQISPNAQQCMEVTLSKVTGIPPVTMRCIACLGNNLGKFDISGQLIGLETVRQMCQHHLERLTQNRDVRLRGYQTLALCAGAAMVILFI